MARDLPADWVERLLGMSRMTGLPRHQAGSAKGAANKRQRFTDRGGRKHFQYQRTKRYWKKTVKKAQKCEDNAFVLVSLRSYSTKTGRISHRSLPTISVTFCLFARGTKSLVHLRPTQLQRVTKHRVTNGKNLSKCCGTSQNLTEPCRTLAETFAEAPTNPL